MFIERWCLKSQKVDDYLLPNDCRRWHTLTLPESPRATVGLGWVQDLAPTAWEPSDRHVNWDVTAGNAGGMLVGGSMSHIT